MGSAAARAACLAAALAAAPAVAQQYPTRTVEIVVPFAPGGSNDLLGRIIAEGLTKRLGQSVVPLNRPGANTNTGTLQVVKSPPDGHTLLISSVGLAVNPALYKRLPFDPLRDLAPITLIASTPTLLVVPA
jgi:tripartite-type tricarboxylate transporter receptor subunit TctC